MNNNDINLIEFTTYLNIISSPIRYITEHNAYSRFVTQLTNRIEARKKQGNKYD